MPEIMAENQDYLEVFCLCDSQLRAGLGGAFAFDWNVVIAVAKANKIQIDERFFWMLKVFEGEFLKQLNKKEISGGIEHGKS